jgi:glucosamine-6-phosphate deaminase
MGYPLKKVAMNDITAKDLYTWCKIPVNQLVNQPQIKIRFRLCRDSNEMGQMMARELVDEIKKHNQRGKVIRTIIPCGPSCWYEPFTTLVNQEKVSLENLVIFHMDECLDWQGQELPLDHPYNFRGFMEKHFYEPVDSELLVPLENRHWLNGNNVEEIKEKIWAAPIDITYGGWGQDGHIAYNQARRHPFSHLTVDELRNSTVRIQENNIDTILALAQRTFGSAYQFVPPMSVTLGVKECPAFQRYRCLETDGFSGRVVWAFDCRISDYFIAGTPGCSDHGDHRNSLTPDQSAS